LTFGAPITSTVVLSPLKGAFVRAAVLQGSKITIEKLADPRPGIRQILVSPLFTGICGSDLHFRARSIAVEAKTPVSQHHLLPKIVPGHEFSAIVEEIGSKTNTDLRPGDRIVGLPFTPCASGFEVIGLSPTRSGGLSTLCLVDEERAFRIPDEVPSELAALTEPLAVGLHAAYLANRNSGPNLVIGCGPVGLAVIVALRRQGKRPIIAADFSGRRRAAAEILGCDIAVDPAKESPFGRWDDFGFSPSPASPLLERSFSGLPPGTNIFDCVGAPGLIDSIIKSAPRHSHVIVVGVCAHEDKFTPREAIVSELSLDFSFAYRPEEFAEALSSIAADPARAWAFVTSTESLGQTLPAFERLACEPKEIKILINPRL
jgi:threonine dehydrogenase-like Zn-dependent dehydrogenase